MIKEEGKGRALVVENDMGRLTFIRDYLDKMGYETYSVLYPSDIPSHSFDLVIVGDMGEFGAPLLSCINANRKILYVENFEDEMLEKKDGIEVHSNKKSLKEILGDDK